MTMWSENSGCRKLIEDVWKLPAYGYPMKILRQKLRNVKSALKVWIKEVFGDIHLKPVNAFKKLEEIQ